MLTDEQIDVLSEALMPYFDELEQWVIQDVERRLGKTLTYSGTIENELAAMKNLGYSPSKIRREVMKLLGADKNLKKLIAEQTAEYKREYAKMMEKINREAAKTGADMVYKASDIANVQDRKIWNEAGKKLKEGDFLHRLNDVFSERMEGDILNLTKTAGFKTGMSYVDARQAYTHSLNNSVLRMASGVSTIERELTSVIHELAQSGIRSVNYGANRSQHIESAVRTALRTTYSQLSGAVMDKDINQTGETLVYVSQHWGARNKGEGIENHEAWQGKVYKLDDREYPEEEKRIGQKITSLVESTGYDAITSTVVDPRGLHGYNCRHSHYAWFEGVSEKPKYKPEPPPKEIDGKVYDYYAMTQKMRRMERDIRAMRKEQIALKELGMDTERQQELKKKISQSMNTYKEFCEKCDIPPKYERTRVEKVGTDIKKTQAYKDYEKMERETGSNSENTSQEKISVENSKKQRYNRTIEQLEAVAADIKNNISQYSDRPSKWSGKINVIDKYKDEGVLGNKEWNCNIMVVANADDGVLWHEMLHSCSVSYYDPKVYLENKYIEESSVEYLKQQICKEKGIESIAGYPDKVQILENINKAFGYGTDIDFAKELFNIPLPERYQWLENKVDSDLRRYQASFEDYNEVMKFIEKLKGGDNG